jgi:hypothetical protein
MTLKLSQERRDILMGLSQPVAQGEGECGGIPQS